MAQFWWLLGKQFTDLLQGLQEDKQGAGWAQAVVGLAGLTRLDLAIGGDG